MTLNPCREPNTFGVPLAAEASERHFKCLCMDVCLMSAALRLNLLKLEAAPRRGIRVRIAA